MTTEYARAVALTTAEVNVVRRGIIAVVEAEGGWSQSARDVFQMLERPLNERALSFLREAE